MHARIVLYCAAHIHQVPPAPAAGNQPGDGAAAAASQAQDAAATLRAASTAGGLPPGCTRVLDLWHASGVPQQAASSSAAAAATAAAAGSTPTVLQQPDFSAAQAAGVPSGQQQHSNEQLSVYEDMLQQYLQQRPQQAAAVGQTAHKPHKPPSRRTHRQPAAIAEQQSNTQQQQEEQQLRPALPDYMTREMLQQYGLLGRITGNLQPHASGPSSATAAAGPSSAAGATADAVKGTEAPAQDDEHEYVYDMYVPVLDEVMTPVEEVDGAEGQQLGAMPVVKVSQQQQSQGNPWDLLYFSVCIQVISSTTIPHSQCSGSAIFCFSGQAASAVLAFVCAVQALSIAAVHLLCSNAPVSSLGSISPAVSVAPWARGDARLSLRLRASVTEKPLNKQKNHFSYTATTVSKAP